MKKKRDNVFEINQNMMGLIREPYEPNDPTPIYESQFKIQSPNIFLPDSFNLLYKTPKPRYQGKKNSCVSFATTTAFAMLENQKENIYSPDFLYHFARVLGGDSYKDTGTTLKHSLRALHRWGVCLEEFFKYDENTIDREPNNEAMLDAQKHKIKEFYKIKNGLYSIKAYIYKERLPVIFGMTVFESMQDSKAIKTGVVPIPKANEQIQGFHGLVCIGFQNATKTDKFKAVFDSTKSSEGYLICLNSWKDYGDEGIIYIPMEFLTKYDYCFDFYVMSNNDNKMNNDVIE